MQNYDHHLFKIGNQIKNYVLIEQIGEGKYGKVFKAFDKQFQETVAIKIILNKHLEENQKLKTLLATEVQVMALIENENIVEFFEYFEIQGASIIVMEYIDGGDLGYIQKNKQPLEYQQCMDYFLQILSAVHELNKHNIIHRDLKLPNILVTKKGVIKLADLGFSKQLVDKDDLTKSILGSPGTMAVEIWNNQPYGLKSDIFSLGIVLFQMLAGDLPFKGSSIEELKKNVNLNKLDFSNLRNSNSIKNITPEMQNLLQQMIEKDVKKRISWEQLYNHPIFKQYFEQQKIHKQQLENVKQNQQQNINQNPSISNSNSRIKSLKQLHQEKQAEKFQKSKVFYEQKEEIQRQIKSQIQLKNQNKLLQSQPEIIVNNNSNYKIRFEIPENDNNNNNNYNVLGQSRQARKQSSSSQENSFLKNGSIRQSKGEQMDQKDSQNSQIMSNSQQFELNDSNKKIMEKFNKNLQLFNQQCNKNESISNSNMVQSCIGPRNSIKENKNASTSQIDQQFIGNLDLIQTKIETQLQQTPYHKQKISSEKCPDLQKVEEQIKKQKKLKEEATQFIENKITQRDKYIFTFLQTLEQSQKLSIENKFPNLNKIPFQTIHLFIVKKTVILIQEILSELERLPQELKLILKKDIQYEHLVQLVEEDYQNIKIQFSESQSSLSEVLNLQDKKSEDIFQALQFPYQEKLIQNQNRDQFNQSNIRQLEETAKKEQQKSLLQFNNLWPSHIKQYYMHIFKNIYKCKPKMNSNIMGSEYESENIEKIQKQSQQWRTIGLHLMSISDSFLFEMMIKDLSNSDFENLQKERQNLNWDQKIQKIEEDYQMFSSN